ncbi:MULTISPECIES: NADPH-dependent FMN reductase [Roseivirga]|jgi:NAD(P)H-dependent FMN reductase|uniref:NADPH-dependent FMN reductase n=1 Tax=Roseivirga spongicola TaxID=333140 RepID=A0A150X929_9BACT|nr:MULTISPECIES: NADPH-dependent FMN reductase [Roseivirga]PWL27553.1 MAG: NAD(P)H-dependent oxidoreductase [Roseivirga sp. XM-24bin3]KYG75184.1 NADPH-dependent FMN reductase [Roseivirga spongicola]MBO6496144.1 NAD(P)H-dependent oxidoreductase [Roseivirga sp.]MBO6662029.1 NAD(P)H-dependent oxidoreductase [Roseivirga sp.]MBO6761886.1 NAD(P)H-dependent oxidoreductase [Roseivirga sp.]
MISIVVGTNRKNSMSTKIAHYYKSILDTKTDSACQIVDLVDLPEDFLCNALYENNGNNESFNAIREKVQASEKIVFIVPEYNGSFPGVLKAFLDGLKYPEGVRDKKGALIGVSSGVQGSVMAMSHLTDILNYLGMNILALKPKLAGIEQHWDGEKITQPLYNTLLHQQAEKLVAF